MDVYELDRSATTSNHILSWTGLAVGAAFIVVVGVLAYGGML
jgi:hypothetical protein